MSLCVVVDLRIAGVNNVFVKIVEDGSMASGYSRRLMRAGSCGNEVRGEFIVEFLSGRFGHTTFLSWCTVLNPFYSTI